MDLHKLTQKAKAIKALYAAKNTKEWNLAEYSRGFVGDVGQLTKLIMAKEGFREIENVDAKIRHELADCLWSCLILADELHIDLERSFVETMNELSKKLSKDASLEIEWDKH